MNRGAWQAQSIGTQRVVHHRMIKHISLKNSCIKAEQSNQQIYPPCWVWWGDSVDLKVRVHSVPCLCWPRKCSLTKQFLFYLHVNCLPPLWSAKPLPSTSSVAFSWRQSLRWGLWPFWPWFCFPGSLPYVYVIKLLCDFLRLIGLMSI